MPNRFTELYKNDYSTEIHDVINQKYFVFAGMPGITEKLTSSSGAIVQYESDSDVKILSDDQAYEQVNNIFLCHYI